MCLFVIVSWRRKSGGSILLQKQNLTHPRHNIHISFLPFLHPDPPTDSTNKERGIRNYRFTFFLLPRIISLDIYFRRIQEFCFSSSWIFLFHKGVLKVSKVFFLWLKILLLFTISLLFFLLWNFTIVDLQFHGKHSEASAFRLAWNTVVNVRAWELKHLLLSKQTWKKKQFPLDKRCCCHWRRNTHQLTWAYFLWKKV